MVKVAAGSLHADCRQAGSLVINHCAFWRGRRPFVIWDFFPEQAAHWDWCAAAIKAFIQTHKRPPRILNLFAYSGLASLHAAAAGAEVTHLDASKKAVAQAFENRDLCGMQSAPIRFITDDATGFVDRELRRQKSYDGIILDPPKYGRGPKGEFWRIEDDLTPCCKNAASFYPKMRYLWF